MIYTIRHCPVRERKGLRPWAVFQSDPGFNRGLTLHWTEQEALEAKAKLEKDVKQ